MNLKKSQEKLKTQDENDGIFSPENAVIVQWGNTIKWNIFSTPLLIYSAKLTLSIILLNKNACPQP